MASEKNKCVEEKKNELIKKFEAIDGKINILCFSYSLV